MPLPWATHQLLRADACRSLVEVNRRYRIEFGENIVVTDAYRRYEVQERIFRERYVRGVPQGTGDSRWWDGAWWYRRQGTASAGVPGTSNHGWAVAVDLGGGINIEAHPRHAWMRREAAELGWVHPSWAHDNNASNGSEEPWHFEYPVPVSAPDIPASGEDEDVVTAQDRQQIAQDAANAVLSALGPTLAHITQQANEANQNAWIGRGASERIEVTSSTGVQVGREATAAAVRAEQVAREALELTQTVAGLIREDEGSAAVLGRVADLRARLPRMGARYDKPGADTYEQLGERATAAGATYGDLPGTIVAALKLEPAELAAIVDGVVAGIEPGAPVDPAVVVDLIAERLSS